MHFSDKTAQIYQWKEGTGFAHAFALKDHKYSVTCVEWSPYGTLLGNFYSKCWANYYEPAIDNISEFSDRH